MPLRRYHPVPCAAGHICHNSGRWRATFAAIADSCTADLRWGCGPLLLLLLLLFLLLLRPRLRLRLLLQRNWLTR